MFQLLPGHVVECTANPNKISETFGKFSNPEPLESIRSYQGVPHDLRWKGGSLHLKLSHFQRKCVTLIRWFSEWTVPALLIKKSLHIPIITSDKIVIKCFHPILWRSSAPCLFSALSYFKEKRYINMYYYYDYVVEGDISPGFSESNASEFLENLGDSFLVSGIRRNVVTDWKLRIWFNKISPPTTIIWIQPLLLCIYTSSEDRLRTSLVTRWPLTSWTLR